MTPPTCRRVRAHGCVFLPDDLDQLAHVHVVWNQELGLVQDRQLFLSLIALNDHLQTGSGASAVVDHVISDNLGLWVKCLWCVQGP